MGLTYKKLYVIRKPTKTLDKRFNKKQYEKEGKHIIFIDESGFSHDTPRTYGYSPKGQGRTNVIDALLGTTLFAIELFDININSDVFYAWVTQFFIPVLPKNSVIMMDNATLHKKQSIQQVIIDAGHMVEYFPTYSPDLNPIKHKWAQAKCKKERSNATQIFCSHLIWCNQN